MQSLRTIEKGYGSASRLMVPLLAVTVGGAALIGGCAEDKDNGGSEQTAHVVSTASATVAQTAVGNTVTGQIETLKGEPVQVRSDPYGSEIGEYRDRSTVEIICQAPGPNAPGDPADFGKPPLADTTWYRLGNPVSGAPFNPERWIPQNPVFTTDPIPACPR